MKNKLILDPDLVEFIETSTDYTVKLKNDKIVLESTWYGKKDTKTFDTPKALLESMEWEEEFEDWKDEN